MAKALLELLTSSDPDTVALAAPGRTALRHGELTEQVMAVGGQLAALGISGDDRVALVLPNGPAMAAAFLCMAPWCATAPLNPAYKTEEFEFYLKDLEAKLLVVEEGSTSPAVAVARKLDVLVVELSEGEGAGSISLGPRGTAVARAQEATALILHTSGTTSRPKMVPLSQANLAASAQNIAATLTLAANDCCLNVMPLFHIHGLMAAVLASVSSGSSVFCTPGFDALRFFTWLDEARATWYSAVPTMHQAIVARAKRNADVLSRSRLRLIRSSSSSLPPQVLAALEDTFEVPVIEAYSMTEAAHQMCSNPLPAHYVPLSERSPGDPGQPRCGYIGPAAGPEVIIVDSQGRELAYGEPGEIAVRGANITSGYLSNPEANANAFYPGGWFRTGDQGVMEADGFVRVTGRLKEIINRGGEKVTPGEVDEALLDHPAVVQACCFAVPHPKLGEEVAAVVVLDDGAEVTERELRDSLGARLADFKVPRKIVFADEIPKGATGKVQRIGLAKTLGLTY